MAAAPRLPCVPVEEYLHSTYEPNCEYIDGALEPKSLPGKLHSLFQKVLILALAQWEKSQRLSVCPELHVRIAPGRYRVPDVALVDDAWDGQQPVIPFLTAEIVSPDEPWAKLTGKIRDHRRIGVTYALIVDPEDRLVWLALPDDSMQSVTGALRVTLPDRPELVIDFPSLFDAIRPST